MHHDHGRRWPSLIDIPRRPRALLAGVAGALALAVACAPAGAHAAYDDPGPWTRTVDRSLSARQLGLPASAPAKTVARAAIRRSAGRLGLRGSVAGVRFAGEQTPRGSDLRLLRFRQAVGGVRVLYSQIDVAVRDGAASSISATTVPFKSSRLRGAWRVSPARARAIARRRIVKAADEPSTLPAQAVAYAGTPAKPHPPRRAYVVQVTPARQPSEDEVTTICVVVDAETGAVLETWEGAAARPQQRGAGPRGRTAQAGSTHLFYVDDAKNGSGPGVLYHRRSTNGDPFGFGWWFTISEWFNGGPNITDLTTLASNTWMMANVTCLRRGFCGWDGGFDGTWNPYLVTGRTGGGTRYNGSQGRVYMGAGEIKQQDILAHEFGHHMDRTYADDRISDTREANEVEEALADMFAYDFERGASATLGSPVRINWAYPEGVVNPVEHSNYPSTMYDGPGGRYDYKCDATDVHYNSTILSHAYYRFVQKVGHDVAGNVLQYIPMYLAARPRFIDVQRGFAQRAGELHGQAIRDAALAAFQEVGIPNQDPPGC
jgi:thermolysin metallopeptidase-like protein